MGVFYLSNCTSLDLQLLQSSYSLLGVLHDLVLCCYLLPAADSCPEIYVVLENVPFISPWFFLHHWPFSLQIFCILSACLPLLGAFTLTQNLHWLCRDHPVAIHNNYCTTAAQQYILMHRCLYWIYPASCSCSKSCLFLPLPQALLYPSARPLQIYPILQVGCIVYVKFSIQWLTYRYMYHLYAHERWHITMWHYKYPIQRLLSPWQLWPQIR